MKSILCFLAIAIFLNTNAQCELTASSDKYITSCNETIQVSFETNTTGAAYQLKLVNNNMLIASINATETYSISTDTIFVFEYSDGTTFCYDTVKIALRKFQVDKTDARICKGAGKTLELLNIDISETVTWSPAIGLSNTNTQNPFASPNSSQMYMVNSACGIDSILLVVDTLDISVTPEDTFLCEPNLIVLEGEIADLTSSCNNEYYLDQIQLNYITASGVIDSFTLTDNSYADSLSLPFDFELYCSSKKRYHISSNGFIAFDDTTNLGDTPQILPSINNQNNFIAAAWADLLPDSSSTFRRFTSGTFPNRIHVIEFIDIPYKNDINSKINAQIHIFETTHTIELHLKRSGSKFVKTSIGIENNSGTAAVSPSSYNLSYFLSENEAFRFTPENAAANFSYFWESTPAITPNSVQNLLLANPVAGDYIFKVTNRHQCIFEDTVKLGVYEVNNSLAANLTKCEGVALELSATGADTYLWSPNVFLDNNTLANPTTTLDSNITYYVNYSTNGCQQTDSVRLTKSINPRILPNAVKNILCCTEDTLAIAYQNFVQDYNRIYIDDVLQSTDSLNRISNSIGGTETFILKAENTAGCIDEKTIAIETVCIEPEIMVSDMDLFASSNFSSSFFEGNEISTLFSWSTSDTSFFAITNPFNENAQFNAKTVGMFDANLTITQNFVLNNSTPYQCVETAETKTYNVLSVGILENDLDADLSIFPNPSLGFVSLQFGALQNTVQLEIISSLGQQVLKRAYQSTTKINLDLELAPGIYYLKIRNETNKTATMKLELK